MQIFKSYETIYSYNTETVYFSHEDEKSLARITKSLARITKERKRDEYIERRNNTSSKRWSTK